MNKPFGGSVASSLATQQFTTSDEPQEVNSIRNEYARLDKGIQELIDAITALAETINPIVKPATCDPQAPQGTEKCPVPVNSTYFSDLRVLVTRVYRTKDAVQDLINRCQL